MGAVVVIGHGQIAAGFLSACDMILGNHGHCVSVCLTEGVEAFSNELYGVLDEAFETYDSVIVMADIKGGTPFNQALKYKLEKKKENMYIVTGTNLPILMELILRTEGTADTEKVIRETIASGQTSLFLEEPEVKEEPDDMDDDVI